LSLFAVTAATGLFAAACAGGEAPERPATPTVAPTAAATNTPSGAQPTARPPQPPTGGAGDPAKGQQLFASLGCSGCHATSADKIVGPGMKGLKDAAGTRVAGMSADAYIEQSIREPNAFVVSGFPPNVMPATYGKLSDDDMKDLIAYLKSL
jgi:cytochrome c2